MNYQLYYITEAGKKANLNNPVYLPIEKKILEILKQANHPLSIHRIRLIAINQNVQRSWLFTKMKIEDLVKDKLIKIKKWNVIIVAKKKRRWRLEGTILMVKNLKELQQKYAKYAILEKEDEKQN